MVLGCLVIACTRWTMTLTMLIAVLNLAQPGVGTRYGKLIYSLSVKAKEDPVLVSAIILKESRGRNICFRGAYGLMQIQKKSRVCSRAYQYDPVTNIRAGIKLMRFWRGYCTRRKHNHHWLLHYNQGYKLVLTGRSPSYAVSVFRVYNKLYYYKSTLDERKRKRNNKHAPLTS